MVRCRDGSFESLTKRPQWCLLPSVFRFVSAFVTRYRRCVGLNSRDDMTVTDNALQCVQCVCLKPGFHYPSSRPELTGRVDDPSTRVHF